MYFLKKITPVRLLKNFSDLYAYSLWKACHPVRLLKTVRLLETLEYYPWCLELSGSENPSPFVLSNYFTYYTRLFNKIGRFLLKHLLSFLIVERKLYRSKKSWIVLNIYFISKQNILWALCWKYRLVCKTISFQCKLK